MNPRDDIDLDRTWVLSDTHFGHKNIIGYCHRPENFEDILLEELSIIPEGDTLLHLGDLCYKGNAWFKNMIAPKIAPQAGRKILVKGNHDHQRYSFYKQSGWKIVSPFWLPIEHHADGRLEARRPPHPDADLGFFDRQWMDWCRTKVSFSHYQWSAQSSDGKLWYESDTMDPDHWRVHGHIHNNGYYDGRHAQDGPDWRLVPILRNHLNVSCEMTKYKPTNLRLLLEGAITGRMPRGGLHGDGEAPTASEIGKESHHA